MNIEWPILCSYNLQQQKKHNTQKKFKNITNFLATRIDIDID